MSNDTDMDTMDCQEDQNSWNISTGRCSQPHLTVLINHDDSRQFRDDDWQDPSRHIVRATRGRGTSLTQSNASVDKNSIVAYRPVLSVANGYSIPTPTPDTPVFMTTWRKRIALKRDASGNIIPPYDEEDDWGFVNNGPMDNDIRATKCARV